MRAHHAPPQSPAAGPWWHPATSLSWTSASGSGWRPGPREGPGSPRSCSSKRAGRGCGIEQEEGQCRVEVRLYRPLSGGKNRAEGQLEAHLLAPDTTQEEPRPAPRLTATHSPFTSLVCPPAIHVIGHFRREGGLRSGGQGEDPGPAEHHAGVDRRAAVLGALQGRQAVMPRAQGGARRPRLQSRPLVGSPFASAARPPAHLLSPLPLWPSKHLASGTLTHSPWEARA